MKLVFKVYVNYIYVRCKFYMHLSILYYLFIVYIYLYVKYSLYKYDVFNNLKIVFYVNVWTC